MVEIIIVVFTPKKMAMYCAYIEFKYIIHLTISIIALLLIIC